MDAYLPAISHALLGEELKIPDIATIWCGTDWGRKEAIARMDQCILRDAFDARPLFSRKSSARLGADLIGEDRERVIARLKQRGETMVLQEISPLGVAPVVEQGKFGAKPVSLRVFAAWTPTGWMVMPGGLTRVAADDTVRALSMQSGASSKDAWVISPTPVDNFSLLANGGRALEIKRHGESAPSRAMDNLFWLGRYAERTESFVRILRAVTARVSDEPAAALDVARKLLIPFSQASDSPIEEIAGDDELMDELQLLVYSPRHSRGLQRLLRRVEQTAWSVRDRLSLDTWRTIHALSVNDELPDVEDTFAPPAARFYLDALVRRAAALAGLSAENMTRGPNWLFMDLGRRIERAQHLSWLVRQSVGDTDARESEHIRILLEIADSAMTYRSRYLNVIQMMPFVDLLMLDENNPRSCAFQLATIESHLRELPRITLAQRNDVARALAAKMRTAVRESLPERLAHGENGRRPELVALADTIINGTAALTDAVADAYFQHSSRRRTGAAGHS
jgi:uncharacterized alpha-E superfamily protein